MDRINTIFDKYKNNQCSPEEIAELLEYFSTGNDEGLLKTNIELALAQDFSEDDDLESDTAEIYSRLRNHILSRKSGERKIARLWWSVAASLLICLSIGGYFLIRQQKANSQVAQNQNIDIAPGHNQATLTLANGKKILLTKGLSGTLAQQGHVLVQVNSQNSLTYTSASTSANEPVAYNMVSTASGEQSPFPLIMADGTKVWLNSKSSIKFPTAFKGNNRTVEVTGEAYFEVVHNSLKPFRVSIKGQTIEDIGTKFNVNAYDDEPVNKTTLLEGAVKVTAYGKTAFLKSGQQTQLKCCQSKMPLIVVVEAADTEEAVAWHLGMFKFNHADIKAVMRQFARWYNVDVAYEGTVSSDGITGKIYKDVNASQALGILKELDIHYQIEKINGINKITITP